jgi:hypothetical protein
MKRTPFLALVLALGVAAPLAACGGQTSNSKVANVPQGDLPAGATFKGVWYNPAFGDLHLIPEGTSAVGKYKSQQNGRWGEIHGTITGDVIHFEWTDHKTGAVGPGSTSNGKGWFKYAAGAEGELPKLKGGWGLGDDEVSGGDWECVLQKDVPPKLESIGGEHDATIDTGWDAEPGKKDKGGDSKGGDKKK